GDQFQQGNVAAIGRKGVFIKEIEDALLAGTVDLAVHSLKDIPTEIPAGLALVAIPERGDPRDCLVARDFATLATLPRGARVGTSSLRRQAQLRHARPDLQVADLRGNVDTRLRRVEEGALDAVVLAYAGVRRLKQEARVTEVLSPEAMLPAAGQGALVVEARAGDTEIIERLIPFNHTETHIAVTAERTVLAALEGGCQLPLGAWARIESGRLLLDACVCAVDGTEIVRDRVEGTLTQPAALGRELGERLLAAGADRLLRLAGR
ncbi:MAG TPA: hydroxymethylbilane synthase, partial [Candidatus Acidoferrales bacterium]|nr:hydroxymethylbilane synthase [Candidatus Acidoferrales bacterium]